MDKYKDIPKDDLWEAIDAFLLKESKSIYHKGSLFETLSRTDINYLFYYYIRGEMKKFRSKLEANGVEEYHDSLGEKIFNLLPKLDAVLIERGIKPLELKSVREGTIFTDYSGLNDEERNRAVALAQKEQIKEGRTYQPGKN